jgi:hypothetical protein
MSSLPYPGSVAEFKTALDVMSEAAQEISRLTRSIQEINKQMEVMQATYAAARKKVFDLMTKMDVASNGNYGYENRMAWFLVELHRQMNDKKPLDTEVKL